MKKIVVDSNILFACLIRNSATRKLIFEHDGPFLFPFEAFEEFLEHRNEILEKSGLSESDLESVLSSIIQRLTVVPSTLLFPFRAEASALIDTIDPDDMVFFACALAFPGSIIWSEDKKLKLQSKVLVYNTREIFQLFRTEKRERSHG